MLRWLTAGESHGPALSAIIEGMPAHVLITSKDIDIDLSRRRLGFGRGARQNFEADKITITGGIRHGKTQGGPIAIQIANSEWPKWEKIMSADPVPDEEIKDLARNAPLTRPRPGHADLVGMQKFNFSDARPILERASARETAARVALGAVARAFLKQSVGIEILSHVVSIGKVSVAEDYQLPSINDRQRIDEDPVRCADKKVSDEIVKEIEQAHKDGDTLGGVVEVLAYNLPPGLGSHTHWDKRLDARLAGAMMGIQAIKGVELGDGFATAKRRGSVAHDEIEKNAKGEIVRRTDRAGGTEGGMSNGEILRVKVAMKPISTVPKALDTIDVATGEAAKAINQRSDVCAVPASGIVAEAMAALVLADAVLEKFGGDSVQETKRNFEHYIKSLEIKVMLEKIVLIGPPGAGKSSIGRALAKELLLPFIDSDGEIEKSAGKKISEIFVDDGEPHFRALEMEKVKELLQEFEGVISLGGGAPINSEISQILGAANYPVIFIDVSIAQAATRIGFNKDRPLLLINPRQQWMNLMSERRPIYEKLATDTVSSDSKKPHEVAKIIVEKIKAKI